MKHVKLMLAALIMVLVLGTAGLAFTDPLLELAVKLELARINAGDDLKQITTLICGNSGYPHWQASSSLIIWNRLI